MHIYIYTALHINIYIPLFINLCMGSNISTAESF